MGARGIGDEAFAAGCYLRASTNMEVRALADTGRAPFKLLSSLAGCQSEGLDGLSLLTIDGEGLVAVINFMFCVAVSEYEDGMGDLWAAKGEPPPEGFSTLVKLSPLHFACNAAFWGNRRG